MADIAVRLGDRSYAIRIVQGLLQQLGAEVAKLPVGKRLLVVSDEQVAPLYGPFVQEQLTAAGFSVRLHVVAPGEASKSLTTAMDLYSAAIEHGLDRRSALLALGGGVVGDLTGFIAATYLRGVPFIQVPTSLLAQVDSSVGGKVAVNHPQGKNLIGAFHQPRAVFIDPAVLQSLPPREFAAGMAEVVKYGLLDDGDFFGWLERQRRQIAERQPAALEELIARSCAAKARIVEQDETESSLRMTLNLGHTIGHGVEAWGGFSRYNHGEAVAIGLCGAVALSRIAGLADATLGERTAALLETFDLPVKAAGCRPEELLAFIAHDKKVLDGAVRWILPERIGCMRVRADLTERQVVQALREIIQ